MEPLGGGVRPAQAEAKIAFANTLRGLAALSVLVTHYYYVFWAYPTAISSLLGAPPLTVPDPLGIAALPSVPGLSLGAFGVALFFLISGFVIPFGLGRTTPLRFAANRILRIYPTYVLGFSITLGALWLGGWYFGAAWRYGGWHIFWHYLPGLRDVLNLPSIDGIIWTLDVEMKFYLVCGLAIPLFARGSRLVLGIPFLLFALSMLAWWWLDANRAWFDLNTVHWFHLAINMIVACQFIVFMFVGVVLHFHHRRLLSGRQAVILAMACLGSFVALLILGPDRLGRQLVPSYVLALVAFILAYRSPRLFRGNAVTDFLAAISYPLYVSHGLAGYVAMRLLLEAGVAPGLVLAFATVGAMLLAWALHRVIERPTQRLGREIGRVPLRVPIGAAQRS